MKKRRKRRNGKWEGKRGGKVSGKEKGEENGGSSRDEVEKGRLKGEVKYLTGIVDLYVRNGFVVSNRFFPHFHH